MQGGNIMETRKYPIPDGIKELATEALAELALRYEIEASVYQQMNTHEGRLLADERLEKASELRQAFDYYLSL